MGNIVREIDYDDMVKSCGRDAREKFKRTAYQIHSLSEKARRLIRAQGEQITDKGVDINGQKGS